MKVTGIIRTLAGTGGVVRVQAHYDTGIEDVWGACTQPERLARWVADVEGDLHLGGEFTARFTSGWEGAGRVEVCEPPHRLVVRTRQEGESQDTQIEATLSFDGGQTLLVVEERGVSAEDLPAYGAGWQVHLEDLGAHLAGGERCDMKARWNELIGGYREQEVG